MSLYIKLPDMFRKKWGKGNLSLIGPVEKTHNLKVSTLKYS